MLKKIIPTLIIIVLSIVFIIISNFISCKSDPIIPDHEVCFSTEILPVFAANCTKSGCHDVFSHSNGYVLTDYINILKGINPGYPKSSKIYKVISHGGEEGKIHKNLLDYYGQGIIKMWIEQGAKYDSTCSPDYCDSLNVTYSNSIKTFFDQKCISCHYPSNIDSTIDLSSFQQSHDYAVYEENILMYRVTYNHKNIFISACERAKVKRWMDTGAN